MEASNQKKIKIINKILAVPPISLKVSMTLLETNDRHAVRVIT
jgi:hypothetical protein